jgi:hypothetical protein
MLTEYYNLNYNPDRFDGSLENNEANEDLVNDDGDDLSMGGGHGSGDGSGRGFGFGYGDGWSDGSGYGDGEGFGTPSGEMWKIFC